MPNTEHRILILSHLRSHCLRVTVPPTWVQDTYPISMRTSESQVGPPAPLHQDLDLITKCRKIDKDNDDADDDAASSLALAHLVHPAPKEPIPF